MLLCQAHVLQAIFVDSLLQVNKQECFSNSKAHMRLALKAQSQCRAAVETLVQIETRRARQSALIHTWQPWEKTTGPKTPQGKAKASRNAFKGGTRARWAASLRRTVFFRDRL